MDDLLMCQLVAENICHEMANRMNVLKFLQEDILGEVQASEDLSPTLTKLFDNIDEAIFVMDFFRNLYAAPDMKNEVSKIAIKICEQEEIKVTNFTAEFEESLTDPKIVKAIAAILFLLTLTKIKKEKYSVEFVVVEKVTIIDVKGCTGDSQRRLIKMLNADSENNDEDAFNIVAHYAKKLLAANKLMFRTDDKIFGTLRIKICK
jgi:hypothetical protein